MTDDELLDAVGEYLFSWAPIPGKLPWNELPEMARAQWLLRSRHLVDMIRSAIEQTTT